jgi:Virulence factor
MVKYQILYWKHVPSQVKVFEGGKRPVSRSMPDRFLAEIDRIAMEEGLIGTDDYLNQWEWTPKKEREGSAEEVAEALVRELEQLAGDGMQARFDQK